MIFCAAVQRIVFVLFFYDLVKLFCLFCFYHYMVNKDYKNRTSLEESLLQSFFV